MMLLLVHLSDAEMAMATALATRSRLHRDNVNPGLPRAGGSAATPASVQLESNMQTHMTEYVYVKDKVDDDTRAWLLARKEEAAGNSKESSKTPSNLTKYCVFF